MVIIERRIEIGVDFGGLRHGAIEIGQPVGREHGVEVVPVDEPRRQAALLKARGDVEGKRTVRGEEEDAPAGDHPHLAEGLA